MSEYHSGDDYKQFYIGTNIFVVRDGTLLLGKRKDIFGHGTWALPGGHLEPGDALDESALRELNEETGLTAKTCALINIVNDRTGDQHRLQLGFIAKEVQGEVENKEPERCFGWEWFDLNSLPEPLFPPHVQQIELFVKKELYSEQE